MQFYEFNYSAQHDEYNLTLYTRLTPLNSETYNSSFTILRYIPADGKSITSMEIVKFNSPATLSRQYAILGKVSKKMGKVYKKSGDESLAQLIRAYHIMEKEAKFLSKLVKRQLSTSDMLILKSDAILSGGGGSSGCFGGDPAWDCFWCEIICAVVAR